MAFVTDVLERKERKRERKGEREKENEAMLTVRFNRDDGKFMLRLNDKNVFIVIILFGRE